MIAQTMNIGLRYLMSLCVQVRLWLIHDVAGQNTVWSDNKPPYTRTGQALSLQFITVF
jgi:hypothetical protein